MPAPTVANRNLVICSDYDGTITDKDVIVMALECFLDEADWKPITSAMLKEKTLTLKEGVPQLFRLFSTRQVEELKAFAKANVQLRAGFDKLREFCQQAGIPFLVVSGGVDILINPVLEGTNLPVYCNEAQLDHDHIELSLPYSGDPDTCPPCGTCAVCKISILNRYPKAEWFRVAIGDSVSDFGMCREADYVFARGILKEQLEKEGIAYTAFEDFSTVLDGVKQLLETGEVSLT